MGAKRLDSVNDLNRHGYDLRVACTRCERITVLDTCELALQCATFGKSRRLIRIVDRLKCRNCGCRTVEWVPVSRD